MTELFGISSSSNAKPNRKFKEYHFYKPDAPGYHLLPFRFHRLTENKEILVNEAGDFIIVPTGTAQIVIEKRLDPNTHFELYADMIANFFISDQRLPVLLDIMATKYRTKKSFLDNFTSLHIFVITLRCEHTCHYCQVSRVSEDRNTFDMRKEHIDRGIEFMMKSPNPHVTMEFQGGEALLAFSLIEYAVEKTKKEAIKHQKKVTYVICTNLAPLTSEMLSFCKEQEILLSTSLDGPAFIHNANRHRPGNNSYEYAINGIEKARAFLGNDRVSALLTTTQLTLQYPQQVVDEYFNRGFRNIFLRPISPFGFAVKNRRRNYYQTAEFLEFYKSALSHIIAYNLKGEFYREDYASIILKKILTPFPVGYVDLQSPAGMINNVVVFNYDGKIYATDESRMLAEMQDFSFQLGDLSSDSYESVFYGKKAYEIAEVSTNESLPGCSDCAFQAYCGADPVMNHAVQGNMTGYRPTSPFCEKNMEIIRHLIELMSEDKKIEKIFWSWVSIKN